MSKPRVTVGIPVYNGEKHIAQSIESVLVQTYRDFVLIICDNASTDGTERICREYAARDPRIRYHRNEKNLGASPNFNKVFDLADLEVEFFQWLAHDDMLAPTYLEKCLAAMDAAPPTAVMAFPQRQWISHEEGKPVGEPNESPRTATIEPPPGQPRNWERRDDWHNVTFASLIRQHSSWNPMFAFGLTRAKVIRATTGLPAFYAGDAIMIAEFRCQGEFVHVPELLFFERLHPWTGWTGRKDRKEESLWWHADGVAYHESKFSRRMHLYLEYAKAVRRAPISPLRKAARYWDIAMRIAEGGFRQLILRIRRAGAVLIRPLKPLLAGN
jgi:glycosyltransferase involved in cell wall biosynthesis